MVGKGGPCPGAGRPKGVRNKRTEETIKKAKELGELPHEFLARVARGENIDGVVPSFQERLTAANAAAPYFQPKLSSVEQKGNLNIQHVISANPLTQEEWDQVHGAKDSLGTTGGATESID